MCVCVCVCVCVWCVDAHTHMYTQTLTHAQHLYMPMTHACTYTRRVCTCVWVGIPVLVSVPAQHTREAAEQRKTAVHTHHLQAAQCSGGTRVQRITHTSSVPYSLSAWGQEGTAWGRVACAACCESLATWGGAPQGTITHRDTSTHIIL